MTRWRDRPRRTLRRWDLDKGYGFYAIATGGAWLTAVTYLAVAVTGGRAPSGSDSRLGNALYGLAALAVASALTTLAVLYLRRPLVPGDERQPEDRPVPPDVRMRNQAEQAARQHRSGTGF